MKEIESLRKVIIDQLKNGEWKLGYDTSFLAGSFKNKYFKFDNTSSGWYVIVNLNEPYTDDPEIKLTDIMSIWHFYYLKIFYVNKSMRNADKRENLKKISEISKKFLDKNKDISRDSKLNEILS